MWWPSDRGHHDKFAEGEQPRQFPKAEFKRGRAVDGHKARAGPRWWRPSLRRKWVSGVLVMWVLLASRAVRFRLLSHMRTKLQLSRALFACFRARISQIWMCPRGQKDASKANLGEWGAPTRPSSPHPSPAGACLARCGGVCRCRCRGGGVRGRARLGNWGD